MNRSTWEQLEELENDPVEFTKYACALFRYGFDGQECSTDDVHLRMFIKGQKPMCDSYKKKVEAWTENGKKGGRPKKNTTPSYDSEKYKEKAKNVQYQAKPK